MAANTPISAWEAFSAILPLIGTGGLTTIIVAVLGWKMGQKEGRPSGTVGAPGAVGIATLYAEQAALVEVGKSFRDLGDQVEGLTVCLKTFDGSKADKMIGEFRDRFQKLTDELHDIRVAMEDRARSDRR